MAYTINTYNTNVLSVVEDGTVDQATDLKHVGRNFAGYGEIQNENFVFLLENFAGNNQPPRALTGQIWYDSSVGKIKYYNGTRWRNTGGTEVATEAPAGLSEGDLWWDSDDLQLHVYTGSEFILVGPQDAGSGVTQMQSRLIKDTVGTLHKAIVSIINDVIVYVFSDDAEYTIDQTAENNAIPNFDVVKPGVTQRNTQSSTNGVTTTDHMFYGTTRNAEMLGGFLASFYIKEISNTTTSLNEAVAIGNDNGLTVGAGQDLKLIIENGSDAVITNDQGDKVVHRIGSDDVLQVKSGEVLPGNGESVNIGANASKFADVYANNFYGLAQSSSAIRVGGTDRTASVDTAGIGTANTIAVRDSAGNLNATLFQGTATQARYADLAEVYSTDQEHGVGTVMTICAHEDHEASAYMAASFAAIGVISEKPAYLMNAEAEGQPIALKGRVPVRVVGAVNKGDRVWAHDNGCASTEQKFHLVGIALESNINTDEKLVECFLMV